VTMSDAVVAAGMDRLPWLADEPQPRARRGRRELAAWAAAATLLVAGVSYWMGANVSDQPVPVSTSHPTTTTLQLPEPRPSETPQPQVRIQRAPEIEPIVAPPMPVIEEPRPVRHPNATAEVPPTAPAAAPPPTSEAVPPSEPPAKIEPAQVWPARVIDGASGRLVRVGAFTTAHQAKKGWWAIVRMNPALKRLPALVVPVQSLRNGRTYYRLQMGTTSQAHSTVLCQRMRMIAQSCVVIGLAGGGEARL
jgi:hypothetical protein